MSERPASVVLYHVPPSFYSQVARLALAEKEVAHVSNLVMPGPPSYETYEPWYMQLNPGGTVPTLVIDGEALDDSRTILVELERRFDGPALLPTGADARSDGERWIERAYAVPERVLAYGSERLRRLGGRVNRGRLAALQRQRRRYPALSSVYDAKIADIERFMEDANDPDLRARVRAELSAALDELDANLTSRPFVAGEAYSLADVVWTVTVARQRMLHEDPLRDRPALADWYARMKARPSFRQANVWERAHPPQMLRVVLTKHAPHVVGILLVLVAIAYAATMSCGD